jgi:O-antigen/teichoic acid export membrane protein
LITIPAGTLTTVVSKYAADFYGQHDNERLNSFFYLMLHKVFIPSIIMAGLVMLLSPLLAGPLKAQKLAFVVLSFNIILSFLGGILNSYLMALQMFVFQVITGFLQVILKICLTYWFVQIGFGATGGVISVLVTGVVGLLIAWWKIKAVVYPKIRKSVIFKIKLKEYFTYSFILSAGSLSLISVDVLLVRYFFSPHDSGIYSSLSVLGRMIYFGLAPLSLLILPVVSKKFAGGEKTKPVWWKLAGTTILFGLIGVGIFSSVPDAVVRLLSGVQYIEGGGLLWLFAVGMLLYALSKLLLTYFMAVNGEKANWILLLVMFLQPVMILMWHESLRQVAMINLIIQSGLLAGLMVYYKVAVGKVR